MSDLWFLDKHQLPQLLRIADLTEVEATVRSAASSDVVRHYGGATSDESQILGMGRNVADFNKRNNIWVEMCSVKKTQNHVTS